MNSTWFDFFNEGDCDDAHIEIRLVSGETVVGDVRGFTGTPGPNDTTNIEWLEINTFSEIRGETTAIPVSRIDRILLRPYGTQAAFRLRAKKCPACGARSAYSKDLDRYIHSDGSDNQQCWKKVSQGKTS